MKRCPKCNTDYSDDTLEFCLEDGTRIFPEAAFSKEMPTITRPRQPNLTTAQTVNLPFSGAAKTPEFSGANPAPTISPTNLLVENVTPPGNKALEIAPLVVALAHNWWQWIYLNNQYYSSFSSYVLSANFLMWLLLLAVGTTGGLIALKRFQNTGFAVASLVVLSINLILFLVPKR